MSSFRFRRGFHYVAELRARDDGRDPSVRHRGYVPTECDDLVSRHQRSWKKYRRTRYKPLERAAPLEA